MQGIGNFIGLGMKMMKTAHTIAYRGEAYWRNTEGSVLLTVVPFLLVVALLIGGFVDFGRGNINRAETLGAIDAAALAAVAMPMEEAESREDRIATAERYYEFNQNSLLGERLAFEDLDVHVTEFQGVVNVRISAENAINTSFLKLADIETINTSTATHVFGGGQASTYMDADIVFIGDVSGSMQYCDDSQEEEPCSVMEKRRGYQVGEKAMLLVDQIFPEDGEGGRVELSEVRVGMTTYNGNAYTYYGKENPHSFEGDSLRSSYNDAQEFIKKYMGNSAHWSGSTCGACGMESAIGLFEDAPMRYDGLRNSPVKVAIFLTDGWIWQPCPPGGPCNSKDRRTLEYAVGKFVDQCEAAKDDDVIVFTIAYGPAFVGFENVPRGRARGWWRNRGRDDDDDDDDDDDENEEDGFSTYDGLMRCASEYTDSEGEHQQRFYLSLIHI